MSVAFVQGSPNYPAGTVLKAYDKRFFGGGAPQRGTPPSGPEVDSATVTALGGATFEHLADEQTYYIGAQVNGIYRWITLRMPPATPGSESGSGITQAAADARYSRIFETPNHATLTNATYHLPPEASEHWLLLEGSPSVVLPTIVPGLSTVILVTIEQDGSGSHTPTFSPLKWAEGIVPSWTATAKGIDQVSFSSLAGVWLGTPVGLGYQ